LLEVEPLIAYTAFLAQDDARLLRESVDWCVRYERFISLHQLRHVVTKQRWPFEGEVARFGATVAIHTNKRWPGIAREGPYDVALSGRSQLPDLSRPSLLQLRLRALLGIGARAEILRVLLARPTEARSVSAIAERTAYSRRQVDMDLEMLELGGLLRREAGPGAAAFALADPAAARHFAGPVPGVAPRWVPLLRSVIGLIGVVDAITQRPLEVPGVELARQLRLLAPELEAAGLRPPGARGPGDIDEFTAWTLDLMSGLARGSTDVLRSPS
jgi:DNA-binding transcriptional ArsR family regulator